MKIKFFKLLIIIYFIFYPEILVSKVGNNIILKIENEIITNFEIKNKIMTSLILVNQEINQTNINNFKKQALDSLIQLKLKKIELSKYNFKNDNTQINNYLKNILRNDIDGFKNNLKKNNLSYELFLDEIETQLKWQKLIYGLYFRVLSVTERNLEFLSIHRNCGVTFRRFGLGNQAQF